MMSKSAIIGAVVVVGVGVAGGGGYYYVSQQAELKFQEQIKFIKSAVPGSTLTYETHHINIFSQEVTMDKVVFTDKDGTAYTADKVDITVGSGNSLSKLIADKIAIKEKGSDNNNVTVEHLNLEDAKAESGWIVIENGNIQKLYPSKISFGLFNIQNFECSGGRNVNCKIAQYQMKDYGLGKKTDIALKDLSINAGPAKFTLAAIALNQVNLAELSLDQETLYGSDEIKNISSQDLMKRYFKTFSKLQFDLFSINQLQLTKKYVGSTKLAHYDVQNYGLGRQTNQSLQDFSIVDDFGGSNYFKVASIGINGVDLALINQFYENADFTSYNSLVASLVAMQKDYIKQVNPHKSTMSITGLQWSFGDNKASLGSIKGVADLQRPEERDGSYTLDNLTFTLPKGYSNTQILTNLGYKTISVSGILREQYQLQTKLLSLSLDQLSFKNIGQISATFKANMPVGLNYNNPEVILHNPDVTFREFTMTVKNTGFVEKLIQKASQEQGISADEVKKSIVTSVEAGSTVLATLSPSFAGEVVKATDALMQDPKNTEIKLTAIPAVPVNGASLAGKDEQEIFNLFNMHIQAEPIK